LTKTSTPGRLPPEVIVQTGVISKGQTSVIDLKKVCNKVPFPVNLRGDLL